MKLKEKEAKGERMGEAGFFSTCLTRIPQDAMRESLFSLFDQLPVDAVAWLCLVGRLAIDLLLSSFDIFFIGGDTSNQAVTIRFMNDHITA